MKLLYLRSENEPKVVNVIIDNEEEQKVDQALTKAFQDLPWPASEKVYIVKQFIVFK